MPLVARGSADERRHTVPCLTEALERLFYHDLDASCHARHVDEAATSNLARDRLWCVVAMVE